MTLEARLKTLLPAEYRESYENVQPVSMGSAGLKFDSNGRVAWDEIWGSFCDLAMAGGPPHKGMLLEPGSTAAIGAQPRRHAEVVSEICRGIRMVTELAAGESENPGWVSVGCDTGTMANWLARAIVMENVSVWLDGSTIELPAAPDFRLEKEIKNVITVIAKTNHYFADHLQKGQQRAIEYLLREMDAESPLVQPDASGDRHPELSAKLSESIHQSTGLSRAGREYAAWAGVACSDVGTAIRMMRLLTTVNVLARREDTILYVPVNPASDPAGELVARAVDRIHSVVAAPR